MVFMIGLVDGLKQKLSMNGSILIGIILSVLVRGGIFGKSIRREKKWNNTGRSIIGESKNEVSVIY
jgi:hypothetical protein